MPQRAAVLTAVFRDFERSGEVSVALFHPQFFERVPQDQLRGLLSGVQRRYGRFVRASDDRVELQRGHLAVEIELDGAGRIRRLRLVPEPLPVRPWLVQASLALQVLAVVVLPALAARDLVGRAALSARLLTLVPELLVLSWALLTVAWAQTSLHLRALLLLWGVALVVLGLRPGPWLPLPWAQLAAAALVTLVFGALTLHALGGRRLPRGALDLRFPLRGGTFVVLQGGSVTELNYHMAYPHLRYALDMVAVDALGRRARGLLPAAPGAYAVWDAQVVSPCAARVAAVEDGHPDLAPPHTNARHPAGNHVILSFGSHTLLLGHLRCGSIAVRPGDTVEVGSLPGRVGNSGNSTEPHLHVHVEVGGRAGVMGGGVGVAVRWNGRVLVRNDAVRQL